MGLFELGDFVTNQGTPLHHKIECDFLNPADWECLAYMVAERAPRPFSQVVGVPRGGVALERALEKYVTPGALVALVVDDVWVTGGSVRDFVNAHAELHLLQDLGYLDVAVAFARNPVPDGVVAVLQLTGAPGG